LLIYQHTKSRHQKQLNTKAILHQSVESFISGRQRKERNLK
jgi:hypothetical protein